jgi:toxin ParE1/3/4
MEKKYEIKYLPIAEQDLTEIIEYVLLDNPDAAINLLNQLDHSISQLELFPLLGITPNDLRLQSLNYRMLIADNYLVFYVVLEDTIEIRRILHGKRKYNFLV